GAKTLRVWGISVGALLLAAGVILFLVALQPVLAGYSPRWGRVQSPVGGVPEQSEPEPAFWPLAFPTIITPYGLALLILLFTLYPISSGGLWVLAPPALVLTLGLIPMLTAALTASDP